MVIIGKAGENMTNFDYLKQESKFSDFVEVAIAAEKTLHIDTATSIINCRKAMESAIKWMYSIDSDLIVPYQNTLHSLMSTDEFKEILDDDLWPRLQYIRQNGNTAVHTNKKFSLDIAKLCIENLYYFMDFIAYCYADHYVERKFDKSLLEIKTNDYQINQKISDIDLDTLIKENEMLKNQLTKRREIQQESYVSKPIDMTEAHTRKLYIDSMLSDIGWVEGKDWINEVEVHGMPNKSGIGYVDYVLYDDRQIPLAIIEAKSTNKGVSNGRQQAKLYADILEKKFHRRPVIFLSNGFEIHIIDNQYPERKIASFYSKRDLEKLFNLQRMRVSLDYVIVNKDIADRYYQEAAIKAVCESFDKNNRRKALLVMATGVGKTRTIMALCDILLEKGWIKNVLFLADRNSLVTQAKRSFSSFMPNLSIVNLCEDKDNYNAHCVFSTYQTMMNCIDSIQYEGKKLYTCGHFDLVICDEAHRSIYNKYKDIFTYFDALLVGLTATPKDEVHKNTYEIFDLENKVPTYGYDLAQAVKDEYLADYLSIEIKLGFVENGIIYDELSEEDKEEYEQTFIDEDGIIPKRIESSAINETIFNEDTIKKVLNVLMKDGIYIDYGQKIGKTIVFAKNHKHAEKILDIFNKEYPYLKDYAKIIDNKINYVQSAIDDFSDPCKLPQIAISVDMLDTGIDIPEIVNLVIFKKVLSKSKFWQMIGRGTRLCPQLLNGKDKDIFYAFDFCGNFDFFRMSKGSKSSNSITLQSAIFNLEFQMAYKLQDFNYQTEYLIGFRRDLVEEMQTNVQKLKRDNFAVRQHLRYVELYSHFENYDILSFEDTHIVKNELSPLILPNNDDVSAVRFDALMYGIELAYLDKKEYLGARQDLIKKINGLARLSTISEIREKKQFINTILNTDYLLNAGIYEFEKIRIEFRDLMKYLPTDITYYDTNLDDNILSTDWYESQLENDDLKNYKMKVEFYIQKHQDNEIINKLKTNQPLSKQDMQLLEDILWKQLGSKDDYYNEFGDTSIGEFIRSVVGLDMNATKKAFSDFLNDSHLNSEQIYFVNQIIEYIVHNGVMMDWKVLKESPFTDRGSVGELFPDSSLLYDIKKVITKINNNAIFISD